MSSLDHKIKIGARKVPRVWLLLRIFGEDNHTSEIVNIALEYFIINTDDIVEGDTSSTHAEGFVRFIYKGNLKEGRVIYSAGSKERVEEKLKQLTRPVPIEVKPKRKERYFLVQYSKGAKDLIQALVHEKDVSWPTTIQANQREVLIFDEHQKRLATVLCVHEDKEYMELEFQKLKQFCFEKAVDENDRDSSIDDNEWILTRYSCGAGKVVYKILDNDTYWGEELCEATIIRKAFSVHELVDQLKDINNSCLNLDFPLEFDVKRDEAVTPEKFRSFSDSVKLFERYSENRKYADMGLDSNRLENAIKDEVAWINEFTEVLDNARRVLKQRQTLIKE